MRFEQLHRLAVRSRRLAAVALAVVLAPGCGGEDGPPRFPITGQVTLDGKPLQTGTIAFHPGGEGNAASADVTDGTFAINRSNGLVAGKYKVEIVSVQGTGKQIKSPDDPTATIEETRNLIPERYSRESRIEAVVKPDAENSYQFDLTAKEDSPRGRRVAGAGSNARRSSLN